MSRMFSVLILLCVLANTSMSLNVKGKVIKVKSVSELQSAINSANKGDSIVLADGLYKDAGIVELKGSEIKVSAASPGGVIFSGNSGFKITGSNCLLTGFQFKEGNIGKEKGKIIEVDGNYNVVSQCNFFNFISHNYIHFEEGAHHNQMLYCNMEAKPATKNAGPAVQITTSETTVSHTRIAYCTFVNFQGDGGDFGNEPIRIGLGKEQNNTSGSVVEFCYFENLGLADNETISIKSTYNVIRYNTFNNNPLGQLTFRTGNRNMAYGNFFFNSGGIRIKEGQDHAVFNNYFEGEGDPKYPSLKLMNFVLNKKTNVGLPLDRIHICNNTFYNAGDIDLGGEGLNPPDHVYFANNILFKKSGNILMNKNDKVAFTNNLYFGEAVVGMDLNASQMLNKDPQLLKGNGFFITNSKSPAVDAAVDFEHPMVDNPELDDDYNMELDVEGKKRTGKKDIGCYEQSSAKPINHPLNRKDVGPSYSLKP